ncbi:hypothetical protein [Sphingopyxis sp. BSNA05]|uniref:hypothetical protein n=1 Tax=Sphingopyxis sp. BSNA05 TaxID=1236614 RepID=UPI0015663067|nr:hypothetical protein [Sphingopyxis sp. BSNA05]
MRLPGDGLRRIGLALQPLLRIDQIGGEHDRLVGGGVAKCRPLALFLRQPGKGQLRLDDGAGIATGFPMTRL